MSVASWLGFAPSGTGVDRAKQAKWRAVREADRAGHAAMEPRRITAAERYPAPRSWWRSR